MAEEEPAPPANQAKWQKDLEGTIQRSRERVGDMITEMRKYEIAEAASKNAAMESVAREKQRLKEKVHRQVTAHGQVIDTSFQCMKEIEDATCQMDDANSKLTHERYAGFAALQVCEKRMRLREKRPVSELFRDRVAECLEQEHKLLNHARNELLSLQDVVRKVVDDMQGMRLVLSRDTGERRLDIMHLESEVKRPPLENEKKSSNEAAPAAEPAAAAEPPPAEEAPKDASTKKKEEAESKARIAETWALLDRAAEIKETTTKTIARIRAQSKKANSSSEEALAKRTRELAEIKKRLEMAKLEVDATIVDAERALARSEGRLDPRDKEKAAKLQQDKALLAKLLKSSAELKEELRCKFAALEIDNMCRRVTPAKAAEQKAPQPQKTVTKSSSVPTLPDINNKGADSQASTAATFKPDSPQLDSSFGSEPQKGADKA